MMWFAACESGWPSDHAGSPSALFSTPRKPLASRAQRARPEVAEGVQRVADDQPHSGEGRVEPVDRGLPLLEVMQVDPAPLESVGTHDRSRRAPVRLLHPGGVEDHTLQLADDVAAGAELALGLGVEIDRVAPGRNLRQHPPVLAGDLDHVVDPGIVLVRHLREAEVGALARVAGHDVVDDAAAVGVGHVGHPTERVLVTELGIDLRADAVEVPVDAGRLLPAADPAGALHGTGMDAIDPDPLEGFPQRLVAQRIEEGLPRTRHEGDGVRREPDVGGLDRAARIRARVGVPPHRRLAGQLTAQHVGVLQHRLTHEPFDVGGVAAVGVPRVGEESPKRAAAELITRTQTSRTCRIPLLVVTDLDEILGGVLCRALVDPVLRRPCRQQLVGVVHSRPPHVVVPTLVVIDDIVVRD
ncbi:hypothetical protein RKD05_003276 [Microbacterium sp. SLBN-111]